MLGWFKSAWVFANKNQTRMNLLKRVKFKNKILNICQKFKYFK